MTVPLLIVAWAVAGVAPEDKVATVETVQKDILEKWSRIQSVSAQLSVAGFLETDAGGNRTTGLGTFEAARIGGENRFRSDLAMVILGDTFGGGELRMDSTELVIYDGKVVNIFKTMTVLDKRNSIAFRRPLDRRPTMDLAPVVDATRVFTMLNKTSAVRLVEASPTDLPPVHVVELTFADPEVEVTRMVVYFDKKTGVVLRTRTEGRSVEWWWNVDYRDVKVNIEMDPNRFVFRLPKGVTFMDDTPPGTKEGR